MRIARSLHCTASRALPLGSNLPLLSKVRKVTDNHCLGHCPNADERHSCVPLRILRSGPRDHPEYQNADRRNRMTDAFDVHSPPFSEIACERWNDLGALPCRSKRHEKGSFGGWPAVASWPRDGFNLARGASPQTPDYADNGARFRASLTLLTPSRLGTSRRHGPVAAGASSC
jgi:hypothetical protein